MRCVCDVSCASLDAVVYEVEGFSFCGPEFFLCDHVSSSLLSVVPQLLVH